MKNKKLAIFNGTESRAMFATGSIGTFSDEEKEQILESRLMTITCSSETDAVKRSYGKQILGHSAGEVRLARLNAKAMVLFNHDKDKYFAVIERAYINDNGKISTEIRFANSEYADRILNDVLDGILVNTSLTYNVFNGKVLSGSIDARDAVVRITDWEPLEVSFVTIPADTTVGAGRERRENITEKCSEINKIEDGGQEMDVKKVVKESTESRDAEEHIDVATIASDAVEERNLEVAEMLILGEKAEMRGIAQDMVTAGKSKNDLVLAINHEFIEKREITPVSKTAHLVGLTPQEKRDFSFSKAFYAIGESRATGKPLNSFAPFEAEVSEAYYNSEAAPTEQRGVIGVPADILEGTENRAASIADGQSAGYFVREDFRMNEYIDIYRNAMITRQAGARVLTGLKGDVVIPGQNGGMTAFWVGESSAAAKSYMTTLQKKMTAKTLAVRTDTSRLTLKMPSVSYDSMLKEEMATVASLKTDLTVLYGDGANGSPTGLLHTSGIGDVEIGTNGGMPTWAKIMQLKRTIARLNAMRGSLSYMGNADVEYYIETTQKVAGEARFLLENNKIGSYGFNATEQLPNDLAKGTSSACSPLIFGNWREIIIGVFGGIELGQQQDIAINGTGDWTYCLWQEIDILVRRVASFAAIQDLTDE